MSNDALQLGIFFRVTLLSMCMFQLQFFYLLYSCLIFCLQQLVTFSNGGIS